MLSRVEASLVDPIGDLYEGDDCFYRAIQPESLGFVQSLMTSGLIDELVSQGLFPETRISSRVIENYPLVLEHTKIGIPSYPFEWSPEMLRAAGLCITQVNDICNEFGYELKDAHPFNVVFDGCRAVVVDFGSISRLPKRKRPDWVAAGEFERAIYYPLYFYAKGARSFFRNAYLSPPGYYGYSDYLTFRFSVLRLLPERLRRIIALAFEAYKRFAVLDMNNAPRKWGRHAQSALEFLQGIGLLPLAKHSSSRLGKRLAKLNLSTGSTWGGYQAQAGFLDESGKIYMDERFQHVVDLVRQLQPKRVVELACNQGALSEHISQFDFVEKVMCNDSDEKAVDSLFTRTRSNQSHLNPMVLDFMLPRRHVLAKDVERRICGDLVIALAVTHHLSLTQGYGFETIFRAIARYTEGHAIVEFMPMGLWDGTYAPPIPDWYSESDFQKGLGSIFTILDRQQVEKNRVVYFLKKRNADSCPSNPGPNLTNADTQDMAGVA